MSFVYVEKEKKNTKLGDSGCGEISKELGKKKEYDQNISYGKF